MMRELASGCGVALSTMTGMVDRLVKKGVMERRHSETDRRVVLITLTGRGKLVYAERLDADMRLVLTMLQALQPDEQQALVSLVHKIVHSLSAAEADGSPSQETQHVHATP
jgi:DNA-binding MarR family transcriptional regulator